MTEHEMRQRLAEAMGWTITEAPHDDRMAPLRRLFADMLWDEAAASVRLDYDQTQTAETTEDICRELRAAGLDPERMQRRVRELRERIAEERRAR